MRDWVALNMTPGVGPRAAARLLERFGSAEGVYGALRSELERLRLRPETVESIVRRDRHEAATEELERVRALEGAEVLCLDDGAYPALLREIPDPPLTLYARGAWAECLDAPCVALVGSRRASTYGQNVALMLARDLASRGVTVVSGLARGVDAAAHRGALEACGRTVGVLGTGVDDVYPRDHGKLFGEILARGGAVVSQFPLGTPPVSENFPYRNRIISGLSLGVVVVEAAENSGSLITARLALEQGREVFAVPGNITSRNSFGTNYLIKSAGAKLVQQWQDVASEMPPEVAARLLPPEPKKDKGGAERHPSASDGSETNAPEGLSEQERGVLLLIPTDEPAHIDALAETTGLGLPELTGALFALEMRDLVRQLPGKCFVRKL
ncbi:MAG TPA: DNA-processing protein DprA [Pyrinomonadaceae bacterium]|nr:DNA-processing protein DprA [Pyrinomonadaceae bacterium]